MCGSEKQQRTSQSNETLFCDGANVFEVSLQIMTVPVAAHVVTYRENSPGGCDLRGRELDPLHMSWMTKQIRTQFFASVKKCFALAAGHFRDGGLRALRIRHSGRGVW